MKHDRLPLRIPQIKRQTEKSVRFVLTLKLNNAADHAGQNPSISIQRRVLVFSSPRSDIHPSIAHTLLFNHEVFLQHPTVDLSLLQSFLRYRTSLESTLIGCPTWKRLLIYLESGEKICFLNDLLSCPAGSSKTFEKKKRISWWSDRGGIYTDLF